MPKRAFNAHRGKFLPTPNAVKNFEKDSKEVILPMCKRVANLKYYNTRTLFNTVHAREGTLRRFRACKPPTHLAYNVHNREGGDKHWIRNDSAWAQCRALRRIHRLCIERQSLNRSFCF